MSPNPTATATPAATATPRDVLASIVRGITAGDLDSLLPLYEPAAAFATAPGSLAHRAGGIRDALGGFIALDGELALQVTRVLEVDDLALVVGTWSFAGTGPDGVVIFSFSKASVLRASAGKRTRMSSSSCTSSGR